MSIEEGIIMAASGKSPSSTSAETKSPSAAATSSTPTKSATPSSQPTPQPNQQNQNQNQNFYDKFGIDPKKDLVVEAGEEEREENQKKIKVKITLVYPGYFAKDDKKEEEKTQE